MDDFTKIQPHQIADFLIRFAPVAGMWSSSNLHINKRKFYRYRGMSCYSKHLSTNLNISQQEQGSVLYLVHI